MTITQNRWLCQSTSFWPQQKLYCGRALWRDPGAFQLTACSQGERPTPNIMVSDLGSIRSHICAGFSGAALSRVTGEPMFTLSTPSFCSTAGHPSPPSSWARHFSPSKHSFGITSHNRGVSHVTHANDAWFINLPFHLILTASNVFPTEGFIAIQTHLRSFPLLQPSFIYRAHSFLSDFSHRQEWWHLDCPLTYLTTFSGVAKSTAFVRN